MLEMDRGIGSEGLEQGGPQLGNDYTRKDLGTRDAGDALSTPNTTGLGNKDDDQDTSLSMDDESSRNLSGETLDEDDDTDDLELDEDELDDDDLADLDEDDDDEETNNTI